jgi:hypothetical protein
MGPYWSQLFFNKIRNKSKNIGMKTHRLNGGKKSITIVISASFFFPFLFLKATFFFPPPMTSTLPYFYLPLFLLFFMSCNHYFSTLHRPLCHKLLNFLHHDCSPYAIKRKTDTSWHSRAANINTQICHREASHTSVTKVTNPMKRKLCEKLIFPRIVKISHRRRN